MPNDSEIEMETWADPGEPSNEQAFEKSTNPLLFFRNKNMAPYVTQNRCESPKLMKIR